jgi:hypothetical protein
MATKPKSKPAPEPAKPVALSEAVSVLRREIESAAAEAGSMRIGAGRLRLTAKVRVNEDSAVLSDDSAAHQVDVELEVYPRDE